MTEEKKIPKKTSLGEEGGGENGRNVPGQEAGGAAGSRFL